MAELTAKQQLFVREYLVDGNASQAAARAGFKSPNKQGPRLLSHPGVKAEIERLRAPIVEKLEITAERVLQELAAIAFADVLDYAEVNPGGWGVKIKGTAGISKEKRAAIAGIKEGPNGVEVKLYDKQRALELLGRRLGMWGGDVAEQDALEKARELLGGVNSAI